MKHIILFSFLSVLVFLVTVFLGSINDVLRTSASVFIYGISGFAFIKQDRKILKAVILYLPNLLIVCYLFLQVSSGNQVRLYENIPYVVLVPTSILLGHKLNDWHAKKHISTYLLIAISIALPPFIYLTTYNYFNFLNGETTNEKFPQDIQLFLENGEALDLAKLKGQVVLFEVWTRSCAACIKEMPAFNEFYLGYRNNPTLSIYSLYLPLKGDEKDVMENWFGKLRYSFPFSYATIDFQAFADKLGFSAVPICLLIDKNGNIVYKGTLNHGKADIYFNIHSMIAKHIGR